MHLPGHKKGPVVSKDAPEPVKEEGTVAATSQVPEPPPSEEPPLPPPNEDVPPPLPPEEPQVTIKLITLYLLNCSAFFLIHISLLKMNIYMFMLKYM